VATTNTFVEELVDDIVTAGIATAKGTDIFFDQEPETDLSPVTTITIKDTGGVPAMGLPIPTLMVQCLVRSTSYETARQTAAEIYNRYHDAPEISLTNFLIVASKAIQLPGSIGEDDRGRHEVSCNYEFIVYSTAQATGATGYGGSKDPNVTT
jgi:hypothetical protein